jgi:hypothetical protein
MGSPEPMMPMQNGMLPESIVEGLAQTRVFRYAMGARPGGTSPPPSGGAKCCRLLHSLFLLT